MCVFVRFVCVCVCGCVCERFRLMSTDLYTSFPIALIALGAAAVFLYRKRRFIPEPPTKVLTGTVSVKICLENESEYRRDFTRFHKSGAIYGWNGSVDCRLAYSLSTSLAIDVLTYLHIHPPTVSQPIYVFTEGKVTLFGFVGPSRGDRPDRKFSDWIIRISLRKSEDVADYDIEPANGIQSTLVYVEKS